MNRIIKLLGKFFLVFLVITVVAIVSMTLGYLLEAEWLKGIGLGLALAGITALLALILLRVTQQMQSVRKAVKQSYDRQLKLADHLDKKIKERIENSTWTSSPGSAQPFDPDAYHGYGVDFEYARRLEAGKGILNTFALTSKSLKIRDALALGATNGRWRENDLRRFIRLEAAGHITEVDRNRYHATFQARNLMRFVGVMLNQQARPTDLEESDLIYRYVAKYWGYRPMPRYDRFMAVEADMEHNRYQRVGESFTRYGLAGEVLQKNLFAANGSVLEGTPEAGLENWLAYVNQVYKAEGYATINLDGHGGDQTLSLFDRLDSNPDYTITDGPKVTILMPTFNADQKIYTAVRSLLKQTWQNFEIIMVDDGSPEETGDLLKQVAQLDDRIKLYFLGRNRGAYVARNHGLERATGEFVTVHDDDDWSHPQKIEFQVRQLLDDPELIANGSNHVRTTEELVFTRLNNNPVVTQFNFSSVMFRRSLTAKLGGWNNVNRSGDSEYKDRIEAYSDQRIVPAVETPMSFTRTGGVSLTQGEMSRGYMDGSRRFYMHVYQAAHRREKELGTWSPESMVLPAGIPENLKDGQRNTPLGHFDVIYMTDFRFPGGNSTLAAAEIQALISTGRRVGIVQLDSPVNGSGTVLAASILQLIEESGEKLSVLSLLDVASTDLLLVRNPSVGQFIDQLETRLSAENVVLIVNSTPVLSDGTGQVYSLIDVTQNLERLFLRKISVVAESATTRELSKLLGYDDLFDDGFWPGMVDTDRFAFKLRSPSGIRKPIIGRHSRDANLKWPEDAETFRQVYVQPRRFATHILGGLSRTGDLVSPADREALVVHEFGEVEPEVFLADLDFWVYFTSDRLKESFGMGAAEAMSCGLVVILPENMRSTFGDGAIYCEPAEVATVVERYWKSPELYREQSERARRVVEENFSPVATLARIDRYIDHGKKGTESAADEIAG